MLKTWSIVSAIVASLFLALFFFFRYQEKTETSEVESKLVESFRKQSELAFAYDGVRYHPFRGVVLVNFQISMESDFARGNYLLQAEKAYISYANSSLHVRLKKPRFSLHLEQNKVSEKIVNQLELWASIAKEISITAPDSLITLVFLEGPYDKRLFTVKAQKVSLKKKNKKLQAMVEYNDKVFGRGSLQYTVPNCEEQCIEGRGEVLWQGKELSLPALQWKNKDLKISSGEIAGELSYQYNNSEEKEQLNSTIQLDNFILQKNEIDYYHLSSFEGSLSWKNEKKQNEFHANGKLDTYLLDTKINWKDKASWPDDLSLSLKAAEESDKHLSLPEDIQLSGLRNLSLKAGQERNTPFLTGNLSIIKGGLRYLNLPEIRIPEMSLSIEENKLSLITSLQTGQSNLNFETTGSVSLRNIIYYPPAYPLMRGHKMDEGSNQVQWKMRTDGNVSSPLLRTQDLRPFFTLFSEYRRRKIVEGTEFTWVPSRLRDRLFFRRFVELSSYDINVNIEQYEHAANFQVPVQGSIKVDGFKTYLRLSDPDEKNLLQLYWDYPTNIPYLNGKIYLDAPAEGSILSDWLPRKYISSAKHINGNYTFQSFGERFADLYAFHKGYGHFSLNNVESEDFARSREIPGHWDEVSFVLSRTGSRGQIKNFQAENNALIASGYGNWTSAQDLSPAIDLRLSLRVNPKK